MFLKMFTNKLGAIYIYINAVYLKHLIKAYSFLSNCDDKLRTHYLYPINILTM